MYEYEKLKRIDKYSKLVGCFKRLNSGKIELFLIILHIIILILCIMDILIIPFKEVNIKSLFALRIVIISFLALSFIICCFNKICRKKKGLTGGYSFCIGYLGSLFSLILIPINFLFCLISTILTYTKVKNYKQKRYDYSSILAIDIFTLLILIVMFFFWYVEVLIVYSKVKNDESLKEFIEAKKRYFQSQNEKVVNVEINEKFNENKKENPNNIYGTNMEYDDISSSNKVNTNEDKQSDKSKDDNISNKEEDNTRDIGK